MDNQNNNALYMLACTHKEANIDIREKFSVSQEQEQQLSSHIFSIPNVKELLILSTCNRIEIYCVLNNETHLDEILACFCKLQDIDTELFKNYSFWLHNLDVIEHLFEVTAGLNSQIIGETEILGQVKEAYSRSLERNHAGPILNRIVQKSFQSAKWARTHTAIGKGQISIGSVSAELALRIFGDLSVTRILVVGSGDVGIQTVKSLKNRGANHLTMTNRTYEKARSVAETFGGIAIHYELFPGMIHQFDVILCTTAASSVILPFDIVKIAMAKRPTLPLFLIDLGVPRNINSHTGNLPNTYLYNLDDLSKIADDNLKARVQEIEICRIGLIKKAQHVWDLIYGKNHQPGQTTSDSNQVPDTEEFSF